MSLPAVFFVIILVAFLAYVVYNAFKKQKSGKIIPGGGGTYPPSPTPTYTVKPNDEVIPEPYVSEYSPETGVILPEPTSTPVPKKKSASKTSAAKKESKKSGDKKQA